MRADRSFSLRGRLLLLSTALSFLAACSSTRAAQASGEQAAEGHPQVREPGACADCHGGLTPEVVAEWTASKHGLNLVQCLVCHGSTGEDFTRRPAPERCLGCHAVELASLTPPSGAAPSCFTCHKPHSLTVAGDPKRPHAAP
jgi:hypothetical protein